MPRHGHPENRGASLGSPQRLDGVRRFDDRVRDYARYRPDYPVAVVEFLERHSVLRRGSRVADIGCGTGKLAAPFLRSGYTVIGVEPNEAMLRESARALARYDGLRVTGARAEALPLGDGSIDAIVAGQAFHWFDPQRARSEFRRVLRPGGCVILIWNNRKLAESGFLPEYEAMLVRHCPEYERIGNKHYDEAELHDFFGHEPATACFDNGQDLDREALRGRLLSSSYVPASGPRHDAILAELDALFARHARNGRVVIDYDTVMFYGIVDP